MGAVYFSVNAYLYITPSIIRAYDIAFLPTATFDLRFPRKQARELVIVKKLFKSFLCEHKSSFLHSHFTRYHPTPQGTV